ncbi:MAG: hypothetical protein WB752_02105, partial [Pseudolabrys sp.]
TEQASKSQNRVVLKLATKGKKAVKSDHAARQWPTLPTTAEAPDLYRNIPPSLLASADEVIE